MELLAILAQVALILLDVFHHYKRKLNRRMRPRAYLKTALDRAPNFAQYEDAAERLDYEVGNDVWRRNPSSRKYDHRIIASRITKLRRARGENDLLGLLYMLRSGLLRNLANIGDKHLYNRSYLGTKLLIQEYTSEVMQCLEYIRQHQAPGFLTNEKKLQFFRDTRLSYGQSALVLQGGVTFGMFHLGVVKALWEQEILPSVLCGTGVGALIAAIVCMTPDHRLPALLYEDYINFSVYERRSEDHGAFWRRLKRFFTEGYLLDTSVLGELCRDNLGELTFEEAFQLTNRVLNITISSTTQSSTPALLNYLTTPHVLIWTAAVASNALPGLFEPAELLCKDETGRIVPWQPFPESKFHLHASTGTPYNRISELFNVNNFITSQARPYLAPFLSSPLHRHARRGLYLKFINVIALELAHRTKQLARMGLLPLSVLWSNPSIHDTLDTQQSELTLVPQLTAGDFTRLLVSPTNDALRYWRTKGERATWPAMACLRVRCLIEMTLKEGFEALRFEEQRGLDVSGVGLAAYGYEGGGGIYKSHSVPQTAAVDSPGLKSALKKAASVSDVRPKRRKSLQLPEMTNGHAQATSTKQPLITPGGSSLHVAMQGGSYALSHEHAKRNDPEGQETMSRFQQRTGRKRSKTSSESLPIHGEKHVWAG